MSQCYSWGGALGHRPIQQQNGPLTTEIAILNLERMAHCNFTFIGNKWKMAHTMVCPAITLYHAFKTCSNVRRGNIGKTRVSLAQYIWPISPRCVRIYIVKITSIFSNLVPVLLDHVNSDTPLRNGSYSALIRYWSYFLTIQYFLLSILLHLTIMFEQNLLQNNFKASSTTPQISAHGHFDGTSIFYVY